MPSISSSRASPRSRSARSSSRASTTSSPSKSDDEARVEHPRLAAAGPVGGQPRDLVVRLEGREERGAHERVREARVASTAGRVRLELRGRAAAEPALGLDRPADGGVALRVQGPRTLGPVGRRLRVADERARPGGVAREDVDVALQRVVAELREPEAALLDEIEREAVAARRDRPAEGHLLPQRRARLDGPLERRALAVPDDRVPALVQPVVGEEDAVRGAPRAPRGGAGVLDLHAGALRGARLDRGELECVPAHHEGAAEIGHRATVDRVTSPLLVRVARREPVERTPVWFMRQAGRSLPAYRALRERHSFFELAETPELCAEVTLEPVRRHGVDAAVLFADIVTPVRSMGVGVDLVEGVGPVVERPVASMADVERMSVGDPDANVLDAIRLVRRELDAEKALVGFCGAPFTVAGYLVEGKPTRDFARTKALMYGEPDVWHALMERLSEQFARYVAAQADAGADVIQLFDSWVGALSAADYAEFVEPYSARILAAVDVPTIHFGTGATERLLAALARAGGDVIGLDWRLPLSAAPEDRAVQGNLDPAVLLGPWELVERAALEVLAQGSGRSHIFNLGHGVLPQTDPDVLTRLTALVQEPVHA
ncbi:MAG: uroporphyrinogen decarboxylase [Acidobacteriota bacterium]|nr:uroporphyrinogen decarboxylase [Acidobacteriota bacterium]